MSFRLFGIPVQVRMMFWATALLLGLGYRTPTLLGSWVAVVFVAVMAHELGHALAARAFGVAPAIELIAFGGQTTSPPLPRFRHMFMAAAGPLASFALGAVALGVYASVRPTGVALAVFQQVFVTTFGWGLLNLVPVWPLDGGQVMRDLLGPKRERATFIVSALVAGGLAALMLRFGVLFAGILFAVMCLRSVQAVISYPELQARARAAEAIALRGVEAAEELAARGADDEAELRALTSLPLAPSPEVRDRARRVLVEINLRRDDGGRALTVLSTMEAPTMEDDIARAQALDVVGRREEAFALLRDRADAAPGGPALGALLHGLVAVDRLDDALELAGRHAGSAPRDSLAFLVDELRRRGDEARLRALRDALGDRAELAGDA